MSRPRIAFVTETALGWSTFKTHLEREMTMRDDIDAHFLPVAPSRLSLLAVKRHNMAKRDKVLRHIDPVNAYAGGLGGDLRRHLDVIRPDLVHVAGHWPAGAVVRSGLPYTLTIDATRAAVARDLGKTGWSARDMATEAQLLRGATHVFAMSHWAAASVIEDCQVPESRVSVRRPSVSIPPKMPVRDNGARLKIVFVGNDFTRKGGDRLVEWANGPLRNLVELHVVSGDPAAQAKGDNITLHGEVANSVLTRQLLPQMDVLCLPTRSDMSPQVLAEAAASGLAVVASRLAGLPDLVVDTKTGILCAPEDDAAFVSALDHLAKDRGSLERMQSAAYSHAAEHLDAGKNFASFGDQIVAHAARRLRSA